MSAAAADASVTDTAPAIVFRIGLVLTIILDLAGHLSDNQTVQRIIDYVETY